MGSAPPPSLAAALRSIRREQTFDLLLSWLLQGANGQPVLAVCEDLHWADPSTLELLNRMMDRVPTPASSWSSPADRSFARRGPPAPIWRSSRSIV